MAIIRDWRLAGQSGAEALGQHACRNSGACEVLSGDLSGQGNRASATKRGSLESAGARDRPANHAKGITWDSSPMRPCSAHANHNVHILTDMVVGGFH